MRLGLVVGVLWRWGQWEWMLGAYVFNAWTIDGQVRCSCDMTGIALGLRSALSCGCILGLLLHICIVSTSAAGW